ncbi:MAG: hypothetical protein ACFB02_18870 [Mastigocoleus sp.]
MCTRIWNTFNFQSIRAPYGELVSAIFTPSDRFYLWYYLPIRDFEP